VEAVADLAGMPAAGRGRAQRPEFLLRDPRRQDLPGRVVVDAAVPHPRQRRRGEPLPPAQQQPAVRPRRVDLAAAAAEQVLGDPLAHRGHRLIRQQDQVEVVHCDDCVGQGGAHGGGVASVRVDHHHLDGGSELGAARGEPGLDRGAGPPVDLPQQGLLTREVDEPGLPRIRAPPPHPAVVVLPVGQPPRPAVPGRVSSIPTTRAGCGSTSSTAPRATTARCTVGHDTPCAAATSDWSRPSSTATASATRSRVVVRIPAGTWRPAR
jgi:hypothetical protein